MMVKIVVPTRGSLLRTLMSFHVAWLCASTPALAGSRKRRSNHAGLGTVGGAPDRSGTFQQLPELVKVFADRAAQDEQVGPEQRMQSGQIVIDARTPGGPIQSLLSPPPGRGQELGIAAMKLEVSELGVSHQLPVHEQRRADTGAEGQQHHDPLRVLARTASRDLGHTGRVGVVQEHYRPADQLAQALAARNT